MRNSELDDPLVYSIDIYHCDRFPSIHLDSGGRNVEAFITFKMVKNAIEKENWVLWI